MAERTDGGSISDIVALWGGRLRAIPPTLVPAGVSAETTQFLTTVGLPTATVQGISFVHDKRMSYLIEHLDHGYLLLAETSGFPFVADPADGRIGTFAGGRNERALFVNSGLAQFLIALGTWRHDVWEPTVAGLTAEDGLAAYQRFETAQRDRDPAAFEHGAYWPQLLENLREGAER
jgi:hypothetical protein